MALALFVADRLLAVLGGFSDIIVTVFLAWLLAFLVSPVVVSIQRRLPLPRPAAVAVMFVMLAAVLGSLLLIVAGGLVSDIAGMTTTWPQTADGVGESLRAFQRAMGFRDPNLVMLWDGLQDQVIILGQDLAGSAGSIAGGAVSVVGAFALVVILGFIMVMDADHILGWIERAAPDRFAGDLQNVYSTISRAFGGFIRTQVLLALLWMAITLAVCAAAGIPYLFLAAIPAGLLMFIPLIGPPLALVPPIVFAFLYTSPPILVGVAVVLFLAQLPLVNIVQPRMMQEALGLHPLLLFIGLIVGQRIAGLWGALFGIPVMAVVVVFVNQWVAGRDQSRAQPRAAPSLPSGPKPSPPLSGG